MSNLKPLKRDPFRTPYIERPPRFLTYFPDNMLPVAWKTTDGATGILSVLEPPRHEKRLGFEYDFFPGVQFGLKGWERAHSQGHGTGTESSEGILFAPKEVNQEFQNRGVESFLRDLAEIVKKETCFEARLLTETRAHLGTLRLKSIYYEVQLWKGKNQGRVYCTATISVSNDSVNPRISIETFDGIM